MIQCATDGGEADRRAACARAAIDVIDRERCAGVIEHSQNDAAAFADTQTSLQGKSLEMARHNAPAGPELAPPPGVVIVVLMPVRDLFLGNGDILTEP